MSQYQECKNPVPQQGNLKLAPRNTSSTPVFTRCSWWFLLNWCLVIDVKCWLIQHLSILEAEQLFFNYRKMPTSYAIWIEGRVPYCIVCLREYVAMIAVACVILSHVSSCKLFYPWANWSVLWHCKAHACPVCKKYLNDVQLVWHFWSQWFFKKIIWQWTC